MIKNFCAFVPLLAPFLLHRVPQSAFLITRAYRALPQRMTLGQLWSTM